MRLESFGFCGQSLFSVLLFFSVIQNSILAEQFRVRPLPWNYGPIWHPEIMKLGDQEASFIKIMRRDTLSARVSFYHLWICGARVELCNNLSKLTILHPLPVLSLIETTLHFFHAYSRMRWVVFLHE